LNIFEAGCPRTLKQSNARYVVGLYIRMHSE